MTIIYKKVGRRYREIGVFDDEALYYPHGAHLIIVKPGGSLTKFNIDPANSALLAAAQTMRDAMLEAMHKANRVRPVGADGYRRELAAKERKAWEAYKAIAGEKSSLILEGASLHDVIDAGIQALIEAVQKV